MAFMQNVAEEARRIPPWGWLALGGGGFLLFMYVKNGNKGSGGTATSGVGAISPGGDLGSGTGVVSGGSAGGDTSGGNSGGSGGSQIKQPLGVPADFGGGTKTPPAPAATRTYTIKQGDTLAGTIGPAMGVDWHRIYDANRQTIDDAARAHGFPDSDGGHWIFPDTTLVIPS